MSHVPLTVRVDSLDESEMTLTSWQLRHGPRGGVVAVLIPCQECGSVLSLAPRTYRDLRAERRAPLCGPCRRPAKVQATVEHLAWWMCRATMAELAELALELRAFLRTWPDPKLPVYEAVGWSARRGEWIGLPAC